VSDLSPDAKDLWERAKKGGFEPTDAQIERVRQAVLERIAAAPTAPARGPSLGSLPRWAKVAGLLVAAGAVVAVGMRLVPRTTPVAGTPAPQATTLVPEIAPTLEVPSQKGTEPATPERAPAAGPAGGPQAAPSNATGRAAPSAKSAASDTQSDTLPEQVRIITDARNALRQRAFAQALAKANDYDARFPKGVFLEEELAIRAMSLCGLGRDKESARVRDTLERVVPNSRQLERVRSSCAGGPQAAPSNTTGATKPAP
jgi:hypothetical protein